MVTHHYEAAKAGHARVVLVTGEPGIGKTRLLDQVARSAVHDGAIVLYGGASEAEGMPPYLPFLEALGRHIQHTPLDLLQTQVAAAPQVLATLLPEVITRLGDLPVCSPLPPEQARFRLYEAIGMFLEAIGTSHVLVLSLDDLQWADTASLDLLCHLARHQPDAHLLILGAYRESELDRCPVLARTISELSRLRVLTTITIGPLSVGETSMLAEGKLGGSLHTDVNSLLYMHSEGNPFFAEELLDDWIEEGGLVHEHHQWVAVTSLDHALPPSIVGALRQRFTRLSAQCIDHLRVAAIIGRTFDLSLLATVQKQEMEAVEEELLEAVHAHLVRTDQTGSFTFSHDKIRECLYAEVSIARRQRLHRLIGHVLETQYEPEKALSMSQLTELAFHFVRSNDRDRGIDYSKRAAAAALHTYAAGEALSHYRMALELLLPEDQQRGDLLLSSGEVALLAGKEKEAETYYASARQWLSRGEDRKALARASHGLGRAYWRQDKRAEARAALEQALTLLGERQCAEGVEIRADLSILLTIYIGRQDAGMVYAQQALEMAQRLGETHLEVMARRILAENLSLRGNELVAGVQFLEQALTQTEAHGNLSEAAECCLNLTVASYWMAAVKRSYEIGIHQLALIERCQQSYHLRTAYTWLALLHASRGQWRAAEQRIEQAHPLVDHLASPMFAAFLYQINGFLAYQQDEYLLAEHEIGTALALAEEDWHMGLGMIMFYLGPPGLVQAALGKYEEAHAYMARVEAQLALLTEGTLPTAPLLICLALTALTLEDYERAILLYPRLLAFRGQHYWFLVDRVLGLLATGRGEWEMAIAHLSAAEVTARREGLRPELARTLLARADVELVQRGQESIKRAEDLLKQALALFEELSMSHSVHGVLNRLRTLASQPGSPTRLSLPAQLTQREAEVLKLVAQGKSNRQIADALGLSAKTVTNYLTHIFNKTTCQNRAAATAFAIRHGLA